MSNRDSCAFCRIVSGREPAELEWEDEQVVAFHDSHPVAPVHLLIVPREHLPTLNEAEDPALLGHMFAVARQLAQRLGVSERGFRTVINCHHDGGQVIYHLHLHLIGGRRLGSMA